MREREESRIGKEWLSEDGPGQVSPWFDSCEMHCSDVWLGGKGQVSCTPSLVMGTQNGTAGATSRASP